MAAQSIRLSSMLSFDDAKEQDIIDLIGDLNSSHKIGQFLSNLIRIAVDNPELLKCVSGRYSAGPVLEQLDNLNQSFVRARFFNNITDKVDGLHKKVDEMYEMVLKTYMLAQMGNKLGLEQKSEDDLIAQFVIEKHLRDVEDLVGSNFKSSILASNKKANVDKLADEVFEYLIDSYAGVIEALKKQVIPEVKVIEIPVQVPVQVPVQIGQPPIQVSVQNETVENKVESTESNSIDFGDDGYTPETPEKKEESVDFTDADTDALLAFFNMTEA